MTTTAVTNPASTFNTSPLTGAAYSPAPATLATAGSNGSASLTQGGALPNITTTQAQATTLPQFYQNYLSNIVNQGNVDLGGMSFAPTTANQTAAFGGVQDAANAYQPGLTTAGQTTTGALGLSAVNAATPNLTTGASNSGLAAASPYLAQATAPTTQNINQYMNPYTKNVVDQIGLLNQENIANTLSPAITSGAVGSGQFGSQRGAQALAGGIANADIAALAQQTAAQQAGYGQALTAAQAQAQNALTAGQTAGTLTQQQAANQITAGQTLGSLTNTQQANQLAAAQLQAAQAQQAQTAGLAGVNAEATLGAQQQAINQAQQNYPLTALQQYAGLLQGQTIPTATSQTYTGPIPGAYSASPLATAAATAATVAGVADAATKTANAYNALTN